MNSSIGERAVGTHWGRKWQEKPFLPYDGIPSGALLYLHDSTRGEEELIFHMEDGKQVFVSDCKD